MKPRWRSKCDDRECVGWFWEGGHPRSRIIQRCDECARFPDDVAAAEHAQRWGRYFSRNSHVPKPIVHIEGIPGVGAYVRLQGESKKAYDKNVEEMTKEEAVDG